MALLKKIEEFIYKKRFYKQCSDCIERFGTIIKARDSEINVLRKLLDDKNKKIKNLEYTLKQKSE